eukprot:m.75081 g.75081  ORF g.75081 m.75081 type:complete len:307 (-) comp13966_c0_seq3:281-1201(-)
MATARVWYASYGSNLCRARLLCYIQGGRLDTMSASKKGYPGCRDKSLPSSEMGYSMPYRMYFARNSKTWHDGGVCFVDHRKVEEDQRHHTHSKIYDVTLDQFNDIVMQENSMRRDLALTLDDYNTLTERGMGYAHTFPVKSWYNTVVCVGHVDDRPVLTFTCCGDQHDSISHNPPADSYLDVILRGLREIGLEMEDASRYLMERMPRDHVDLFGSQYQQRLAILCQTIFAGEALLYAAHTEVQQSKVTTKVTRNTQPGSTPKKGSKQSRKTEATSAAMPAVSTRVMQQMTITQTAHSQSIQQSKEA